MDIDLSQYNISTVTDVEAVETKTPLTFIDIEVDQSNTFFIVLPSGREVLSHNCDGIHITSQLIGWFAKYAPNIINEGRICRLNTPLVVIKDKKSGNITNFFFELPKFRQWELENPDAVKTQKIVYLKGLGSWEREDLQKLIDKYGFENFVQTFRLDEVGMKQLDDWLGDDADKRKEYLRNYSLDIDAV